MVNWLDGLEELLFQKSRTMDPPWGPVLRRLRYPVALIRDWLDGEINIRAMSLAYTTLLSLVPLMVFGLSVLKGLGARGDRRILLHEFFRPMGSAGTQLTETVMQFVTNMRGELLAPSAWRSSCTPCHDDSRSRRVSTSSGGSSGREGRAPLHRVPERHDLRPPSCRGGLRLCWDPPSTVRSAQWLHAIAARVDHGRVGRHRALRHRRRRINLHVFVHSQYPCRVSRRADRRRDRRHHVGAGRQGIHRRDPLFLADGGGLHGLCHRADHSHLGVPELADIADRRAARILRAISPLHALRPRPRRTQWRRSRTNRPVDHGI